jgi:c-di-GMP-binding flagellar brake protein YcgR
LFRLEGDILLKIGAKVYIRRIRDRRERWYNSRVDDQEKSKLIIALPMEGGVYLRLRHDEEIEVGFIYKKELYCVLARVEGILKGGAPCFFITTPTQKEVYLKKRRDAERVDLFANIKGTYDQEEVSREIANPVVLNISRTGMLLSADMALPAGSELELRMKLAENTLRLRGSVLGLIKGPSSKRDRYRMRVLFTHVPDDSRKYLTSFIKRASALRGD